ncbi:UNVERIFIED_CONTAM: hypothetical protein Sradi_3029300 [Sesamum radiatum]|uniref:DEUBAD domain-containing protein n=1 Tax=Sesamum radiatum TaxID=300843 RepID=A0AAW2RD39_SESRA
MAADQRKKRVNSASLVGCTSREQYRVNRKKLQVQQHGLDMRPNISLEWDNKRKSVVSKKEQIGIRRRHLIPFVEPGPHAHSILADVFSVPEEIFELENLSKVLSYEVWQNHLSGSERSFLSQFLPKEPEADTIVRDLLAGDNFHFGNPFVKWGASLCFGELHPDYVLHEEQSLKASKKAYYLDLQKYHNDMIESLQTWKERWASCQDAEVDIMHNMWSSGKQAERSMRPSETRFDVNEEYVIATPESCSWANSEIAYSSDNQNLGMVLGESQRRKDFLNKISDNSSSGLKVTAGSKKGEKLQKRNFHNGDGTKYMSYIKVSKEQHERVKSSMKHAGNSIQPRSLNNVLGSIDSLNVEIGNSRYPSSFANWRKSQLQKKELALALGEEIGKKLEHQEAALHEEKEGSPNRQMELSDDTEEEIPPSSTFENEKDMKSDYIFEERMHDDTEMIEAEDAPRHVFIRDHNQKQIASVDNSPRNTMITPSSPGGFSPSASDVLVGSDVHGFYYQSTAINAGYASAQELSIGHPQFIQEQTVRMLDMQTHRQDKDAGKNMLHRQPDDISLSSVLTLTKTEVNFLDTLGSRFIHHFLLMLSRRDLMISTCIRTFRRVFILEAVLVCLDRITCPNIHDWATVNTVRMPVPPQSHLNSGELSQSWYTGENGTRDGWPSFEVAVGVNHSLSSGSNSDQTLFSVLSECSELRPRASYDSMGSTERMVEAGNYSGIGGGIPSSSNFLQQSPNPLNYLSGHEAAAGIKINNLGWTGMPQQNSGIQESMGKPFLRSWNQ